MLLKIKITAIFLLLLAIIAPAVQAQQPSDIVEVYGLVVSKSPRGAYEYVPFVTVAVQGTVRGTYANYEGMYSIVVKKGQTLTFSAIGYAKREIVIPEDITGMYYSLTVELEPAEINLDEVTIFPWPDRDNLAAEFLALQPTRAGQLETIAKDNLNRNQLLAIAQSTDNDSKEAATQYLRQQASTYSYQGQMAPQAVFDPLAWSQFFQQINGKTKKRSAREENMIRVLEGENGE